MLAAIEPLLCAGNGDGPFSTRDLQIMAMGILANAVPTPYSFFSRIYATPDDTVRLQNAL
jgi:hypothetical protein